MSAPIYYRYLRREVHAATLLVLVAFLGLFGFFDLINELDDLGKGDYQLQHALLFTLLTLPGRAYETFPIAVLIGALYSLTTLARHSEINVLRTSGLATGALLRALARLGLVYVMLTFCIGEFVAPPAEQAAQRLRLTATTQTLAQQFRSGFWVKDENRFINVRSVTPDARLQKVRIFEFDDRRVLKSISEAREATYEPPQGWHLSDVVQTHFEGDRAVVSQTPDMVWESGLSPDVMGVLLVSPDRMSAYNLVPYIQHLMENKQESRRYEIALWKKLVYPFTPLVMLVLALPFAYTHSRMSAVSIKVFTGVMLGVFFYMLNGLFSNLGAINAWPPLVAALTPALLFLFAGFALLWWEERR